MHWIHLTDENQLQLIVARSQDKPQVIFKYSSRCFSSEIVFSRLKEKCCPKSAEFYFLDIIAYHSLSNQVAEIFHVHHESPQVLIILDGSCIYEEDHLDIEAEKILDQIELVSSHF